MQLQAVSAVKTIQIKIDKKRRNFERKDNEGSTLVEITIFLAVVLLLLLLNIWTLFMVRSAAKKWEVLLCSPVTGGGSIQMAVSSCMDQRNMRISLLENRV